MSTSPGLLPEVDPFDARLAARASGLLRDFNRAGILSAADVHVARRIGALAQEREEAVLLAVALAVRAPRLGHVYVDLAQIRHTAAVDAEETVDLEALAWPEPGAWKRVVAASPLVAESPLALQDGAAEPGTRPLRLAGDWLYLDRYWSEEVAVAAALESLAARAPQPPDLDLLRDGLGRLFGTERRGDQSLAAATAVLRRLAVVAGGPGTGKTTTVARIVALLCEQALAAGDRPPLVALAAPTGKAAARLQAAVNAEGARLDVPEEVRAQLRELPAVTLHRLLGRRPGSNSRFRHNRTRRLPHDVVIVDETSMVSLSLMARLLEALRAEARLVLVGDPGQLASIEAGAVLGDIVGPAAAGPRLGASAARALESVTEVRVPPARPPEGIGDGIVVLEQGHRFGAGIAELASAIRSGDEEAVLAQLRTPADGISWLEVDIAEEPELPLVHAAVTDSGAAMIRAAGDGRDADALAALASFRLLCAHRRGPYGVSNWTARVEGWLEPELPGLGGDRWYPGRPLLVTENDYELGLNNGDTGVVVRSHDRVVAVFERGGGLAHYSPTRLGAVDTVYAMTIHKSQGSQFETAAVLLPDPGSRLLTRELLYTAVTRAQKALLVAGTEEAIRAAVRRPAARASGLRSRLWDEPGERPRRSQ